MLSQKLLRHLDDPDSAETYGYFFLGPLDRTDVPARNGYLIGWRIAQELGRSRSPPELARMTPAQIRPELVRVLERFAREQDGGTSGSSRTGR